MNKILLLASCLFFTANAYSINLDDFDGMPWANNSEREVFNFSEHPNGVFVIEGYFYSCPYCQQNAPNVHDLASDYENNDRVVVMDVAHSRDNDAKIQAWIRKHNPNHPVVSDQVGLLNELGIRSFPTAKVLDCEGNVVFSTVGVWNTTKQRQIRAAIDTALETVCE